MKKRVLIPFTTGVEELELVAIVDLLRRAHIEACMASLDGDVVTGRSGITLQADAALDDVMGESWDMIVLPGGLPNAHLLRDHTSVQQVVLRLHQEKKIIAAICAAPIALATLGITHGMQLTAYPSCQSDIEALQPTSTYLPDAVVEDDWLITSRGAGTAIEFALRLIAKLSHPSLSEKIRQEIVA